MHVYACACVCVRGDSFWPVGEATVTHLSYIACLLALLSYLPDRKMRFAYNAAIDTPYQPMLNLLFGTKTSCLPSASSLASPHRPSSVCSTRRLCDSIGLIADTTLYYLLSNNFVVSHIQELRVLANLPGQIYCFPMHIAATDEWPDIVTWNGHQCTLVELTVPFEDNFADAD